MPMFDLLCDRCGAQHIDVLLPVNTPPQYCRTELCAAQGGRLQHAWLSKPPGVIGDECDVNVKHGLCNSDGTPRRYTSKAEMKREAKARGYVNHVEHIGAKGSDKSKHTTRWI